MDGLDAADAGHVSCSGTFYCSRRTRRIAVATSSKATTPPSAKRLPVATSSLQHETLNEPLSADFPRRRRLLFANATLTAPGQSQDAHTFLPPAQIGIPLSVDVTEIPVRDDEPRRGPGIRARSSSRPISSSPLTLRRAFGWSELLGRQRLRIQLLLHAPHETPGARRLFLSS